MGTVCSKCLPQTWSATTFVLPSHGSPFLVFPPVTAASQRLVRAFKAVEELRYLDDEALLSKLIYTAEKYQQLAFGQSVYDPNMFRDIEVFFGL